MDACGVVVVPRRRVAVKRREFRAFLILLPRWG
jgi:hypothetical protein